MFNCSKCGLCCMNIGDSPLFEDLNRGDGICKNYDESSKLCAIYKERPVKCNVDLAYVLYFSEVMSLDEFYELNYAVCRELRRKAESDKETYNG